MIRRRLDAALAWLGAWTRRHHLVSTAILITIIAAPGYLRIEGIVQSIIDARSEGRIVSCHDANEVTDKFDAAITYAFQPQPGAPPRSPEQQARNDELLKHLLIPRRVCTPQAIADHLKKGNP